MGDFTYGVRANLATIDNKVTKIHESLDAIDGVTYHTYGAITRFEKGYPAWHFYGYKFTGIDSKTGEPTFADLNGDGQMAIKTRPTSAVEYLISPMVSPSMQPGRAST